MGVVIHAWACPKLCETVSHLLKNEFSYKVSFLLVVRDPQMLQISSFISSVYSGMLVVFENKELAVSENEI